MIYLALIVALAVGYVIGMLQHGIKIYHEPKVKSEEIPKNKSVGLQEFTQYYDQTDGVNKF